MKTRDEIVKEIAAAIVNSKNYSKMEWDSISVHISFEQPSIFTGGIVYLGDDYISKNPASWDLTDRAVELKELMEEEDGNEWVTCLIKISAVTQEIDIDFEYEDVKRWYLTPTMDKAELRAYAMSIK